MDVLQELLYPLLTVLFLVCLTFLASMSKSSAPSNSTLAEVNRTLHASHILCSPNTSDIRSLVNMTLRYLQSPQPDVSFYQTADNAEEAYLSLTIGAAKTDSPVVGVHFDELAVPSSVNYSFRFRSVDVADTEVLFDHECE